MNGGGSNIDTAHIRIRSHVAKEFYNSGGPCACSKIRLLPSNELHSNLNSRSTMLSDLCLHTHVAVPEEREILPDPGATICSVRHAHRSLGCSAKRNIGVLQDGALAYWQRGRHTEKWLLFQLVHRLLPQPNHHDVTLVVVARNLR